MNEDDYRNNLTVDGLQRSIWCGTEKVQNLQAFIEILDMAFQSAGEDSKEMQRLPELQILSGIAVSMAKEAVEVMSSVEHHVQLISFNDFKQRGMI